MFETFGFWLLSVWSSFDNDWVWLNERKNLLLNCFKLLCSLWKSPLVGTTCVPCEGFKWTRHRTSSESPDCWVFAHEWTWVNRIMTTENDTSKCQKPSLMYHPNQIVDCWTRLLLGKGWPSQALQSDVNNRNNPVQHSSIISPRQHHGEMHSLFTAVIRVLHELRATIFWI